MQGGKFRGRSGPSQCASAILMVRPKHFGFNAQTAGTNRFQQPGRRIAGPSEVAQRALREFDAFAAALAARGRERVRGAGFRLAAQARRGFPEQLGEFPRRRHRGAVSHARREPPRRTAHRKSSTRWCAKPASRCAASSISRSHEKAGRFLEGTGSLVLDHRGARGLCLPLAAHRRGSGARMGARDGLRARAVHGHRRVAARPSTTPTCSCTWARASRWWRSTRSRRPTASASASAWPRRRAKCSPSITRRCAPSPATCWKWAAGTSTWATSTSW